MLGSPGRRAQWAFARKLGPKWGRVESARANSTAGHVQIAIRPLRTAFVVGVGLATDLRYLVALVIAMPGVFLMTSGMGY